MFEQQFEQLVHGSSQQRLYQMGRITPYQPMHEPRREVSLDRMHQILAKRSGAQPEVSREPVAPAPNTELPKLEWAKPEQWFCKTTCGRYSVAKCMVGTKATYQCWKLTPGSAWFLMIGTTVYTFADAQAIAQADSEKQ
jgi:hypothetical protein